MTLTPNPSLDLEVVFREALVGATGPAGNDGSDGADGLTTAITFTFSTTTTDSDPGAGTVRISAGNDELYIDNADSNAGDVTGWLDAWDDIDNGAGEARGVVYIFDASAPSKYKIYNVTGAVTDGTGYRKVAVTAVDSNGVIADAATIGILFVPAGPKGAQGDAGAQGSLDNNWQGAWADATAYATGDLSENGGSVYIATSGHTSASGTEPGVGASWATVWDLFASKGNDGVGTGDVTAASNFGTDNVVVRADGSGKGVQLSGLSIDDSNNLSGVNNVTGADVNFATGTAGASGNLASWNADGDLVDAGSATSAFAAASHNHAASDINSGTFADARIAESNVTQHLTAATLTHERGGLEADVSAYSGLVKITGGATSAVTVTAAGEALLDDADAAAQRTTLGLGTAAVLAETTSAEFRNNTADRALSTDQVWGAAAEVTLTDGATIAVDLDSGINFVVTLGGNRTLASPTNEKVGQSGYIRVVQDGTGSRTLSFGTDYEFAGGTAPTLTTDASAEDVLFYVVLATNRVFISSALDIQ